MSILTIVKTFVISLGLALVIYLAYQFFSIRAGNSLTEVNRADCLVILGAAVWEGGEPSPILRDRIARAAELYHKGVAEKIICSGGVGTYPPAEAAVEKEFLIKAGVPAEAVIMESMSTSTAEQALFIKEICDREKFRSIALVTSFYHEKRSIQLFDRTGFDAIEDARCTHGKEITDLDYRVAREALALALINWWRWGLMGLGLGLFILGARSIRRREAKRGRMP